MKKFKVGLQLYSVRAEMEKDFEGTLKAVKDMGYDYVEFAGFYGKSTKEVKELLDKIGLTAISVHEGSGNFNEKGQEAIDYLKDVGVKYCAVPWYNKDEMENNWDAMVEDFKKFSAALKNAGIKLLYHNHDFEFKKDENGVCIMDYILENTDPQKFKFVTDLYWCTVGGVDAVAAPILSSVCVVSLLLSRIFLKEKLSWKTYAFIAVVIIGILLLAVSEEL